MRRSRHKNKTKYKMNKSMQNNIYIQNEEDGYNLKSAIRKTDKLPSYENE